MRVVILFIHVQYVLQRILKDYRGTGFLTIAWFGYFPTPSPLSRQPFCLFFSCFMCLMSPIIRRRRESLVLYKSFNTFCCTRTMMKKSYLTTISAQMLSVSISICAILYPNKEIARLWQLSQSPHINYHIMNVYILGQHVQYTAKYALLPHFLTRYLLSFHGDN